MHWAQLLTETAITNSVTVHLVDSSGPPGTQRRLGGPPIRTPVPKHGESLS